MTHITQALDILCNFKPDYTNLFPKNTTSHNKGHGTWKRSGVYHTPVSVTQPSSAACGPVKGHTLDPSATLYVLNFP